MAFAVFKKKEKDPKDVIANLKEAVRDVLHRSLRANL